MESRQNSTTTAPTTPTATRMAVGVVATNETRGISCSPLFRRSMTPDNRSVDSVHCRICHDDGGEEELIDPCECTGTLGLIHLTCLERWLSISNTDHCEICKYTFEIEKRNKPLSQWWRSRSTCGPEGIISDVVCLIVLTPVCIIAAYLCGIGASAYAKLGMWECTGLAILCGMLIVVYFLWLFATIRFHVKSWQQWSRKNQDIKLIVKRKSDRLSCVDSRIKTYWIVKQDNNNNNNSNSVDNDNRFTTRLLSSFHSNADSLPSLQQETIFV